jgi:hypothetical protein
MPLKKIRMKLRHQVRERIRKQSRNTVDDGKGPLTSGTQQTPLLNLCIVTPWLKQ